MKIDLKELQDEIGNIETILLERVTTVDYRAGVFDLKVAIIDFMRRKELRKTKSDMGFGFNER